jgi:tripartite-type tricarboxylate transporter receptor subunit TctC
VSKTIPQHIVVAPKDIPVQIIEALNREINAALTSPVIATRFADLGAIVFSGSAAED